MQRRVTHGDWIVEGGERRVDGVAIGECTMESRQWSVDGVGSGESRMWSVFVMWSASCHV